MKALAAALGLAAGCASWAPAAGAQEVVGPSPAILCAERASHPDDPDRIRPGLEREEMDLAAATEACRRAVADDPADARSAYHLGRALYYGGDRSQATPHLERAAEAGYGQSIFVLGYVLSVAPKSPADLCRAGELWRRAAGLDHPWSGYHLVEKQLDGKFRGCSFKLGPRELRRYMALAADNITVTGSAGRVEKLQERLRASLGAAPPPPTR